MEDPRQCIKLLADLLLPPKAPNSAEDDGSKALAILLKENIINFTKQLVNEHPMWLENLQADFNSIFSRTPETLRWDSITNPDFLKESGQVIDFKWLYAVWNLVLLHRLSISIKKSMEDYNSNQQRAESSRLGKSSAPALSPDTLSFTEQKTVTKAVQFIVCLGILPFLQPGVGVPFERRSDFSQLSKELQLATGLSEGESEWRLMVSSVSLTKLINTASIATLVISRHLGDLLASLLQLVCASSLKRKQMKAHKGAHKGDQKDEVTHKSLACGLSLTTDDVRTCEDLLKGLLDKVSPPALVQELLLLQGGPPPTKGGVPVRSPVWLRNVCGRLLSDILVKPRGVQFVLRGMLGPQSANPTGPQEVDWRKCDAVSKIIAHCPRKSASVEEYYKCIAPQVIELLQGDDKEYSKQFLRVAVGTINVMATQHPDITKKYVLRPLLDPLYTCFECKDNKTFKENEVVVTEQALTGCIHNAHKLFAVGMEPQSVLLRSLHELMHILFTLYTTIQSGVSHLRSPVEELLLCYLKQSDCESCVQVFTLCAFGHTCRVKSVPVMRRNLRFSPAAQGGVQVIYSQDRQEDWEERVTCVVSLMEKTNNDQVVAQIFIDLLRDLTSVISAELDESGSPSIPLKLSLLELEQTEEKLMSNVMMLSLLAAMCDKLGETCFKSTPHILDFVKATLERCVMVLTNTPDETTALFGSETVAMGMGLLTAVMGGAAEVSAADREKTKELLPLLQTLSEEHQDETIREMATDLRIAIATHGFVLSDALRDSVGKRNTTQQKPGNKDCSTSSVKEKSKQHEQTSSTKESVRLASNDKENKLGQQVQSQMGTTRDKSKSQSSVRTTSNNLSESERTNLTGHRKPLLDILTTPEKGDISKSFSELKMTESPEEMRPKKPLIEVISSTDFDESPQTPSQLNEKIAKSMKDENCTKVSSQLTCSGGTEEKFVKSSTQEDEGVKGVEIEEDMASPPPSRSEREYRENYAPGQAAPQSTSSLKQAFEELLDPLIPVRGHALISLRRLLEQRDRETLQRQDTLVKIFHENLDHSDTYIYLAAIQGLAVLANRLPDRVLPLLAEEYVNFDRIKRSHDQKDWEKVKPRSPELRMKLGEVLMKCIRDLGDTAPKYRDLVLRSLLSGTRDTDPLVRASSLSNLAEICRLLRFSLGGVIYEVLECVSSLLKSEQELEVKRAAVVVLSSILQGVGPTALKVLGSALRDVYHLLKHVERTETDPVLLLHTDKGLEALDTFMRDFLFPKQTLTKKICVLDPPGDS